MVKSAYLPSIFTGCLFVTALGFAVTTVGCGSDSDDGKSNSGASGTNNGTGGASDGGQIAKLECYGTDDGCDSETQFCIVSKENDINMSGICAPIPSGCNDCGCLSEVTEVEWEKATNGTNNCSNVILSCEGSQDGFTVTCLKKSL